MNYVPTHVFHTTMLGETPTDNWFACVSGEDPLPDLFIGRISVRAPSDLEAVVEKVLSYEEQPPQPWHSSIAMAADDSTAFENMSEVMTLFGDPALSLEVPSDTDDDGVPDGLDNCPEAPNPDQLDGDEDDWGGCL